MSKANLKNNTVNVLRKILKELTKTYKGLNIDEFTVKERRDKCTLVWHYSDVWIEGDSFKNIEKNLIKMSHYDWRIFGKCAKICCKLKIIERS